MEFDRWFADHGDETLRLDYQIGKQDVVIDCGAYHGNWSRSIYDRYHCRILAFEPVKEYCTIAKQTLAHTGVLVFHSGIGPFNETCDISVNGCASSVIKHSESVEQINIVSIDDVIRDNSLSHIRLIKINIEGAEYDLLDHMLNSSIVSMIDDIQIQFHQFVDHAVERRENIRASLQQTHHLTYDYEFVWENWRINA
ncbi:MAG: FkbM family methyltransferase [Candidatus Cloacimonetes bacterium]|jgi:FkbM family methyltransferase|nr:FkbM family methyltransferase [Candidatus Cloacimonadota bacterium]